jgi:hypothetical protein
VQPKRELQITLEPQRLVEPKTTARQARRVYLMNVCEGATMSSPDAVDGSSTGT